MENYGMTAKMLGQESLARMHRCSRRFRRKKRRQGLQILCLDGAAAISFGPGCGRIEQGADLSAQGLEQIR